jgi:hypothetical protein
MRLQKEEYCYDEVGYAGCSHCRYDCADVRFPQTGGLDGKSSQEDRIPARVIKQHKFQFDNGAG